MRGGYLMDTLSSMNNAMAYIKKEMIRIAKLIKETGAEYKNGEVKSYDDVDKMFMDMEST